MALTIQSFVIPHLIFETLNQLALVFPASKMLVKSRTIKNVIDKTQI